MQAMLRRYRDLTVLAVVVLSQLVLLGSQVRGEEGVPLVRRWAVSAVVPIAKGFALVRDATVGSVREFFVLLNARSDNQQLRKENDRLKLENQFLKSELGTAERGSALAAFQKRTQSKTIAARLIGSGLATNTQTIFIDRGLNDGVKKGFAIIVPDGIVGKVIAVFPAASQVMLLTDPAFAAGVVSGKSHIPGTLRGDGSAAVRADYMPTEAKVEKGEWFYTSGDDRVFPRGLPVGRVTMSGRGRDFRDVKIVPSGLERGLEEVLVVMNGLHELLPGEVPASDPTSISESSNGVAPLLPPLATEAVETTPAPGAALPSAMRTDADRALERYRKIGEAQGHRYGSGRVPDFNAPVIAPAAGQTTGGGTASIPSRGVVPGGVPAAAPKPNPATGTVPPPR